jgi:hypothetical protein
MPKEQGSKMDLEELEFLLKLLMLPDGQHESCKKGYQLRLWRTGCQMAEKCHYLETFSTFNTLRFATARTSILSGSQGKTKLTKNLYCNSVCEDKITLLLAGQAFLAALLLLFISAMGPRCPCAKIKEV